MQRNYAERYDWLEMQFKECAFLLLSVTMYYSGTGGLSEDEKLLYRQSVRAFEGVAPVYRLELYDRPTIVWESNSLMQAMQLMISIMLSDDNKPVKICRNCGKAFRARRQRDKFCSRECSDENNNF